LHPPETVSHSAIPRVAFAALCVLFAVFLYSLSASAALLRPSLFSVPSVLRPSVLSVLNPFLPPFRTCTFSAPIPLVAP